MCGFPSDARSEGGPLHLCSGGVLAGRTGRSGPRDMKRMLRDRVDVRVYTPGEPRGEGSICRWSRRPRRPAGSRARHPCALRGGGARRYDGLRQSAERSDPARDPGKGHRTRRAESSLAAARHPGLVSLPRSEGTPTSWPQWEASIPSTFARWSKNSRNASPAHDHLFRHDNERLSPELFFGRGIGEAATSSRCPSSCTKFMGTSAIDFWVARTFGRACPLGEPQSRRLAAGRGVFRRGGHLSACAEQARYQRAHARPLKRGRDSRTWRAVGHAESGGPRTTVVATTSERGSWVGREKTAVDKMKPLLSDCRINVGAKLAQAKSGEFFKLEDGDVVEFKGTQSLMQTTQASGRPFCCLQRRARGRKERRLNEKRIARCQQQNGLLRSLCRLHQRLRGL